MSVSDFSDCVPEVKPEAPEVKPKLLTEAQPSDLQVQDPAQL